jgi:tetratricopeptide (TPR) repeat protein
MYKEKKYNSVVRIANRVIEKNANSIFLPEILAYKIRALDEQKKYPQLIEVSEPWVETYTTHKDLPEMMLLTAKAYLKIGNTKKADYYIDVLIRDYKKSIYSQLATIYKADRLQSMIKEAEAMILYRRVLDNTKDVEVASIAANKLAGGYTNIFCRCWISFERNWDHWRECPLFFIG